jgi:flagellar motor switch protein FliM
MMDEAYNFRKPGRLDNDRAHQLRGWLHDGMALTGGKSTAQLSFAVTSRLEGIDVIRPPEGLDQLPATAVAYQTEVGPEGFKTLLVLPRPLSLGLVAGALGDTVSAWPADRDLTTVEESLCDYVVQQLMVASLQEAWPGQKPLGLSLGPKESQPKRTRLFPPSESVIVCTFVISGPAGDQTWHWLLPQKELLERLASAGSDHTRKEKTQGPRLETLIQELPLALSVELGSVALPLTYLAQLKPGDVLILDQRVTEPLRAAIAGRDKFRVWPGRVGARQAVQVAAAATD